MLSRALTKTWVPLFKATSFQGMTKYTMPSSIALQGDRVPRAHVELDKVMPTQMIREEIQDEISLGTGHPAQRGHRKPLVWKRRNPWFTKQWTLDLKRVKKGPETPHFPEGVPFTMIRKFKSFSGRGWKVNAGRRRKIRLSLKRGRRKLL